MHLIKMENFYMNLQMSHTVIMKEVIMSNRIMIMESLK